MSRTKRIALFVVAVAVAIALIVIQIVLLSRDNNSQAELDDAATAMEVVAETPDFGPQLALRLHCTEDGPEVKTTFLVPEFELPEQYVVTEPEMLGESCAMLFDVPDGTRYVIYSPGQRGIGGGNPSWKYPYVQSGSALTAYTDWRTEWKLVAFQFPGVARGPLWEQDSRHYDSTDYQPRLPKALYRDLYPNQS